MGLRTTVAAGQRNGALSLAWVAILAVGLMGSAFGQVNLIRDGGFELDPSCTYGWDEVTSLGAWTVEAGNVDIVCDAWTPHSGRLSLDLNGSANGRISQTFATVPGEIYKLVIWYSGNPGAWNEMSAAFDVLGSDHTSEVLTWNPSAEASSSGDMAWRSHVAKFTAMGNSATVRITSLGGDAAVHGIALDDISVTLYRDAEAVTESFEDGVLDPRIAVATTGAFLSPPGIGNVSDFGSLRAFRFGRSVCHFDCWDDHVARLVINLGPAPVFVTTLAFKEKELLGNWGSDGGIYVDGVRLAPPRLIVEGWSGALNFGRLPYNDQQVDVDFRRRTFVIDRLATQIELRVSDITDLSEMAIDDLIVYSGSPPATSLTLLSGSQIDFGVAAIGQSAVRTIRVRNTGTASLQVTAAPEAPYVAREPSSLVLAPGAIGDFNVAFSPTVIGRQDAAIQLISNGGNATIAALGYAVRLATAVPAVTSQVPAAAAPLSVVSLRGRALGWTPGVVSVDGQVVSTTYWSDTAIDMVVPRLAAGIYPLAVTTSDGRVGAGQLTVLGPSPVITRVRPTSGTAGSDIIISGANFGNSAAEITVTVGGAPATIAEWATDWLRVKVPDIRAALHPVNVSTSAGSAASTFRVRPLLVNITYGECVDYFAGVLWGILEAPCPPVIATVTTGSVPGTNTLQLQNLTAKWYSVVVTPVGIAAPVVSPWIGPRARVTIADLAIPPGASLSILADGTTDYARAVAVVDGLLSLCPALGVRCPRFPATAEAVELVRFTASQSSEFVDLAVEIYDAVAGGELIDAYAAILDLLALASEDPYVDAMFTQLGVDVDTASMNAVSNFLRVFKATAMAMESVFAPPFGTVLVQGQ